MWFPSFPSKFLGPAQNYASFSWVNPLAPMHYVQTWQRSPTRTRIMPRFFSLSSLSLSLFFLLLWVFIAVISQPRFQTGESAKLTGRENEIIRAKIEPFKDAGQSRNFLAARTLKLGPLRFLVGVHSNTKCKQPPSLTSSNSMEKLAQIHMFTSGLKICSGEGGRLFSPLHLMFVKGTSTWKLKIQLKH